MKSPRIPFSRSAARGSITPMKALCLIIVCCALAGCSFGPSNHRHFEQTIREFSSADVRDWKNTLLIGEMFPNGRTIDLSDRQAQKLQAILSHAQPAPEDDSAPGIVASPAPQLCGLTIAGKTWYFLPPAEPLFFRLPREHKVQFQEFMSQEFGRLK